MPGGAAAHSQPVVVMTGESRLPHDIQNRLWEIPTMNATVTANAI